MARDFSSNQLLFNMGVPFKSTNMAAKFRSPQPILVEKLGVGRHTPLEMSYNQSNLQVSQSQQKPVISFSLTYMVISLRHGVATWQNFSFKSFLDKCSSYHCRHLSSPQ